MGKKVIVAGHICLDITPVFPDKKVSGVSEMLAPGKLIEMGNVGCAYRRRGSKHRAGLKTAGGGCVPDGKNRPGRLRGYGGGDTEKIRRSGRADQSGRGRVLPTRWCWQFPGLIGFSSIIPAQTILFRAADIPRERIKDAALFHFGYPPLMRSMYTDGGAELVHVLRMAQGGRRCHVAGSGGGGCRTPRQGRRTGEGFWSGRCPMWISLCRVSKNCAL